MRTHFHLFDYGAARSDGRLVKILSDCEQVGRGAIGGVLYSLNDEDRALVLYGSASVEGELWRCPNEMLDALDAVHQVDEGRFRRIGVAVSNVACWTYVAGPRLTHGLTPERRTSGALPAGRTRK